MNNTASACPRWGEFANGVTNGADWYPVEGGMQDFNYLFAATMEVTVEISCCKFAHKSRLLSEWENNKESILTYVEQAQTGVKGETLFERKISSRISILTSSSAEVTRNARITFTNYLTQFEI
jgi:hypothetical protein